MAQVLHYPTLKTVLDIERVLAAADTVIAKNEIKRRLKSQVMHQTLNVVLEYLEASGKVVVSDKGVSWIAQESPKLKRMLSRAVRVA